jgi:hypothetical protein
MIPPSLQVTVVCALSVMWNTYFSMATKALGAAMSKENDLNPDIDVLLDSNRRSDGSISDDSTEQKV